MSVLSLDEANKVTSAFLVQYYNRFVQPGDMGRNMSDFYGDNSFVSLADVDDQPATVSGKTPILNHFSRLGEFLRVRKVHVMTADALPAPSNTIQVVCQGMLYVPGGHRIFLHVFTLTPTPYKENTYFIAADYLRFVNFIREDIPEGATVVTKEELAMHLQRLAQEQEQRQIQEQRQQQQHHQQHQPQPQQQSQQRSAPHYKDPATKTSAAPAPQQTRERPPRGPKPERPEREERKPRSERPKNNKDEKKPARGGPSPAAAAAEEGGKKESESNNQNNRSAKRPSAFIRLCDVPQDIKLSDIKAEISTKGTNASDAYWFGKGSKHAVVELASTKVSSAIVADGKFSVKGKEVKVVFFSP